MKRSEFNPDDIPDGTPEELEEVYGITEGNVWDIPEPDPEPSMNPYGIPGDTWEGVYYHTQPDGKRRYIYRNLAGYSDAKHSNGLRLRPRVERKKANRPVSLRMAQQHLRGKKSPPQPKVGWRGDPCMIKGCKNVLFPPKGYQTKPRTPMCQEHYRLWKEQGHAYKVKGTSMDHSGYMRLAHIYNGQLLERTLMEELEARGVRDPWRSFVEIEKKLKTLLDTHPLAQQTDQYLIPRITSYYQSDHLPIYLYRKCRLPRCAGNKMKFDVRLITRAVFSALVAVYNIDHDDPRYSDKNGVTLFDKPTWNRTVNYTLIKQLTLNCKDAPVGPKYKARGPHDKNLDGLMFVPKFKSFFAQKIYKMVYDGFQPFMPEGWDTLSFIKMLVATKVNPENPLWVTEDQSRRLQKIAFNHNCNGAVSKIDRPFMPEKYQLRDQYGPAMYYHQLRHPEETLPLLQIEDPEEARAAFMELRTARKEAAKPRWRAAKRRPRTKKQSTQQHNDSENNT